MLTATGEAASRDLTKAFRQIITTVDKVRKMEQGVRLIISVDPSFAAAWLVPRLQDFRIKNPTIEVLIDSSMEVVDLQRGAADIAIRFGVPPDESLVTRRLFDEEPNLLLGHQRGLATVALSPDGEWIASGSVDGTLRLWPMPDLDKPPFHTLPYDELMARLKKLTNLRAVPDENSHTGYRVEPDFSAYHGWAEVPEW